MRGPARLSRALRAVRARGEADARVAALRAAGFMVRGAVFTAEDGGPTTGPWVMHVLAVDPRAGRARAGQRRGRRPRAPVGDLGSPRRAGRHQRRLLRDRRRGRHAGRPGRQLDPRRPPRLRGRRRPDRPPAAPPPRRRERPVGPALGGGGRRRALAARRREPQARPHPRLRRGRTDVPTALPLHDITCTDPSELVHSTPIFGAATETGPGPRPCSTAAAGSSRSAIRAAARSPPAAACSPAPATPPTGCAEHARPGTRLRVRTELRDERGDSPRARARA